MNKSIGFIGLGKMGEPMARNLLRAGYKLRVYNRTSSKAQALAAEGAEVVETLRDVINPDGIVVSMVANDHALEEVVMGEKGIGNALGEGGIHISMSTVSPHTAQKLAAHHEKQGTTYLAAPVFGRPEAAAAKKLWICLAGDRKAKERVRPVLEELSQGIFDFGEKPEAANVVKLAGNFLIGAAIEAMAEAFTFAEKNGVSREDVADLFSKTFLSCPIYQNYGTVIATQEYKPAGFKVSLGLKDMTLLSRVAASSRTPMPLGALLQERLQAAMNKGRADMDWTALALGASEDAGLSADSHGSPHGEEDIYPSE
ncbi:MAG TPA: NAD(P)-dependent oxidoreductase [Sideroxyarcus sp.]|nr:NAD(P)-dependent oxidoreductase [Sideroxyarcus sp.]